MISFFTLTFCYNNMILTSACSSKGWNTSGNGKRRYALKPKSLLALFLSGPNPITASTVLNPKYWSSAQRQQGTIVEIKLSSLGQFLLLFITIIQEELQTNLSPP